MFEVGDHDWNVRTFRATDMFNTGQLTHNVREKTEKENDLFDEPSPPAEKGSGKFDRRRGVTNK